MLSRFADGNRRGYLYPAAQDNETLGCGFDVGHSDAQHVGSTAGIPQGVPASLLRRHAPEHSTKGRAGQSPPGSGVSFRFSEESGVSQVAGLKRGCKS